MPYVACNKNWSISSYHLILRYKISKRRARNVPAKPSGSPYMVTRLTEGTHLNHVNNPGELNCISVFLDKTFNSIFQILAVLLYLHYIQ